MLEFPLRDRRIDFLGQVDGWVGGLGIGVTKTSASAQRWDRREVWDGLGISALSTAPRGLGGLLFVLGGLVLLGKKSCCLEVT